MKRKLFITLGLCVLMAVVLVLPKTSIINAFSVIGSYADGVRTFKTQQTQLSNYKFELSEQVDAYAQSISGSVFRDSAEIITAIENLDGVRIDDINTLRFANGKIYTIQKVTDKANLGNHEGLQLILTVEDIDATLSGLYNLGILFEEMDILAPSKVINLKINLYNNLGGGKDG